jgi:hypothetical protein
MKLLFFCALMLAFGCNAASDKSNQPPTTTQPEAVKADAVKSADAKTEDCDDKAKKPIEIKEETISLSGNTGCTLDEAKPGL